MARQEGSREHVTGANWLVGGIGSNPDASGQRHWVLAISLSPRLSERQARANATSATDDTYDGRIHWFCADDESTNDFWINAQDGS
jgi:hypothetical protein